MVSGGHTQNQDPVTFFFRVTEETFPFPLCASDIVLPCSKATCYQWFYTLQFPPNKFPAGVWLGCVDFLQIDHAGLYLTYLGRERVR